MFRSTGSDGRIRLLNGDRTLQPRDAPLESRCRDLWQNDDCAVRLEKEFEAIAGFQVQMLSNLLGDCRLILAAEGGFHGKSPALHYSKCKAISTESEFRRAVINFRLVAAFC
jgi:hypothetical protein